VQSLDMPVDINQKQHLFTKTLIAATCLGSQLSHSTIKSLLLGENEPGPVKQQNILLN
jgi:hypothetical protein